MSWQIGAITLPFAPTKVTSKQVADAKTVGLLERMPLILGYGPKTGVINIDFDITGDTPANLETNYLIPLQAMAKHTSAFHYIVYDEAVTAWTLTNLGIGAGTITTTIADVTTPVAFGLRASRIKTITVGAGNNTGWRSSLSYASPRDWTKLDFLSFQWYGSNTGNTIRFAVGDFAAGNYYYVDFIDPAVGYTRFFYRKGQFSSVGTPAWNDIDNVWFESRDNNIVGTWYLDRVVVGLGQYLSAPDTRYDGIWFVSSFTFEERGGWVRYFPCKLELWDENDYF